MGSLLLAQLSLEIGRGRLGPDVVAQLEAIGASDLGPGPDGIHVEHQTTVGGLLVALGQGVDQGTGVGPEPGALVVVMAFLAQTAQGIGDAEDIAQTDLLGLEPGLAQDGVTQEGRSFLVIRHDDRHILERNAEEGEEVLVVIDLGSRVLHFVFLPANSVTIVLVFFN